MKQGLQIKQSQNMVMTPQLQESIKILQLATIDLIPYIAGELEQNPFLERDDGESSQSNETHEAKENHEESGDPERDQDKWDNHESSGAVYEGGDSLIYSSAKSGKESHGSGDSIMENISAPEITLRQHVIDQINVDIKDPAQRLIALHLTDHLDESGYIIRDLMPLSEVLQCDYKQVDATLKILQGFDPAGVFARDLAECLSLQLKERNRLDPAMQALLENLDLMVKCDFKALKKICGVSEEDLKEMCLEIKALNPKPGNNFSSENVQVLLPDVFLKQDDKNKWFVELNSDALPKVLINRRYYAEIEGKVRDKVSRKFMSEQFNTANWLVKALDQRAHTILKVATEIIVQQDEFFRKGIHYLKPLVIADIAQVVEAHESTVSRVINGKYIATHMGTYELKYFFSSGVSGSEGGEDVSSKRIKYIIKQLVDAEEPKKILSDDKLAAMLKEQGVDVARRTVMKYRESMNIPSSVQRRREKSMN